MISLVTNGGIFPLNNVKCSIRFSNRTFDLSEILFLGLPIYFDKVLSYLSEHCIQSGVFIFLISIGMDTNVLFALSRLHVISL